MNMDYNSEVVAILALDGDGERLMPLAMDRCSSEAARARLREAFSVAGFVRKFTAVYDEMTASALRSGWARVWRAVRSSWFQITSRAYAGVLSEPPSR